MHMDTALAYDHDSDREHDRDSDYRLYLLLFDADPFPPPVLAPLKPIELMKPEADDFSRPSAFAWLMYSACFASYSAFLAAFCE